MGLFNRKQNILLSIPGDSSKNTMDLILKKLLNVHAELDHQKKCLENKIDEISKEYSEVMKQVGTLQSELDRVNSLKEALNMMSEKATNWTQKSNPA